MTKIKRSWSYVLMFLLVVTGSSYTSDPWRSLLDRDLSQWETYLSYRHVPGYSGGEIREETGKLIPPIGYNKDDENVFSVIMDKDEPVLRISGEIYGAVFTKEAFENYHLKLKVKWGTKKWPPRMEEYMDSGILYHSQGEAGVDYWKSWMLSQELQIIERGMGDYWSIANSQIDIKAEKKAGMANYVFNHDSSYESFGEGTNNGNFCQVAENREKPMGEWNTIELICFQDKSLHVVNGKVVMALTNSRFEDENGIHPLVKGKIQLQSEAAEVYFRDIQIKDIDAIPSEYEKYF